LFVNRAESFLAEMTVGLGEGGDYGVERAGSGQGQEVGVCERGNEPSGPIKCGEFLALLNC